MTQLAIDRFAKSNTQALTIIQSPPVAASPPFVSVIVRSFRRQRALLELMTRLLNQRYSSFEVVVLEMSEDPELCSALAAIADARVRVVTSKPLDPPAARNAAIRHSRGDILVLIDDDDLPLGVDWIQQHVSNYDDPKCMGIVGRLTSDPERIARPQLPKLTRMLAMRHTLFKDTRCYANNSLPKVGIHFLIGSNASVRRSLVQRIGGWDEGIPMGEEQSFAFRFARLKSSGEYFKFDPAPVIWRRTNVPGGLGRREKDGWHLRELEARLFYYKHVVGHYFPLRFALLRPLFVVRAVFQVLEWIWDPDNREHSASERLRASVELFLKLHRALMGNRYDPSRIRRGCPGS